VQEFLTTQSRLNRCDKSVKVADSESKSRCFWGQTRVLSTGSREAYPRVMYDLSATMSRASQVHAYQTKTSIRMRLERFACLVARPAGREARRRILKTSNNFCRFKVVVDTSLLVSYSASSCH